jgi:hypothetical protein
MSHFTRIRTRLCDEATLRTALGLLGYQVEPAGDGVYGYGGKRTQAQFKIRPGRNRYEIGFQPTPRGYVVVADWWGLKRLKREEFTRLLAQRYALVATRATLEARGFQVDEQLETEDGEIRLVLRRTVGV